MFACLWMRGIIITVSPTVTFICNKLLLKPWCAIWDILPVILNNLCCCTTHGQSVKWKSGDVYKAFKFHTLKKSNVQYEAFRKWESYNLIRFQRQTIINGLGFHRHRPQEVILPILPTCEHPVWFFRSQLIVTMYLPCWYFSLGLCRF